MQRQTYPNIDQKIDDIGERIDEQIQSLQAQTDHSLHSLIQRIADLELENARLKRTIKNKPKNGSKSTNNIFSKLGKMVSIYEDATRDSQRPLDSTPFVVGLIDGSKVVLLQEDVQNGREGGITAANRFYDHLAHYMTERKVFEYTWRLIVKFYASMSELGTTYLKDGIIDTLTTWREFIDGFNSTHSLCCFVDAGNDEQAVQTSLRNQIDLCFGHGNCQHTVLLGSDDDNTYTGFLRHYEKLDELCGRLTIIEAIPFPGEYEELAGKFLPKRKDLLFDDRDCLPLTRCSTISPPSSPITPKSNARATTLFGPRLELIPSSPPHISPLRSPPKLVQSAPRPRASPPRKSQARLVHFLSQGQLVKRKPLAPLQPRVFHSRVPRSKNAFFNSNGQRIDSNSYVHMYTERYLQC